MQEEFERLPDPEVLVKELDCYMSWIKVCLQEDCVRDVELDMKAQLNAAEVVKANVQRVYEV